MTRSVRRRPRPIAALSSLGLLVFLAGCAKNARQDSLDPAGPRAQAIHDLAMPVFAVAGIVFVVVMALAIYIAVRFRAKDDTDYNEFPDQIHGHFKAEIAWTIAPAVVLAIVGIFTVVTVFDLAKEPTPEAVKVRVIGHQWWWEYRYDIDGDGDYSEIINANEMVIPAGREVALSIESRDVIHSWWAPQLHGKKDAVPGRRHPLTLIADEPGEYFGQCTEFCGLSHAQMHIKVVALDEADYEAWVDKQQEPWQPPTDQMAIDGWKVFASTCTSCHQIRGMTDPSEVEGPDTVSAATSLFEYPEEVNQVAGVVPDLTTFMGRSTFAGAMFNLRHETDECVALGHTWASTPEGIEQCLNKTDLEAWLRDSPSMKAMYAGDAMTPESRGMPNMNLSEDQIDQVVAFLITLGN